MKTSGPSPTLAFLAAAIGFAAPLLAQTPEWIWHDNQGRAPGENEVRFFRKSFSVEGKVARAILTLAGDDRATAYLNGKEVAANRGWNRPTTVVVTKELMNGENLLAIRGQNNSGDAALIARMELTLANNQKLMVLTDSTWSSSAEGPGGWETPGFTAANWTKVVSRGKLGVPPWGDVLAAPSATPADKLATLPGFAVQLIRSAEPGEGSWVCLTVDSKGRLLVAPQGEEPMLRFTLSPDGKITRTETVDQPVRGAMGLLYAFDSLYVNGKGKDGLALYRLSDTDGDDRYDSTEIIRKWQGDGGEHGPHGIVLGPDKKLYVVSGNFVNVPDDILPNSPHRNYADDIVLPRMEDGNGFGAGKKPPGGFVARMDPDGRNCELFAAGFRNTYDIAFNSDGELFGFDSDMEWDWGTPWYRPIRINHIVSGGDYGFREGTAKWPNWYPDSLPTTLDIGIGSPTGVKFGMKSRYPEKYQRAFFVMDWSYGRILAIHLEPLGSTYTGAVATAAFSPDETKVSHKGAVENFVVPKGLIEHGPKATLNVTDLEFGQDGAMYFLTGGRGTQSGLYRVSYVGQAPRENGAAPVQASGKPAAEARALRHRLEAYHGKQSGKAVDFAWPHLNDDDRWIRYAARLAIESQPVAEWKDRALNESKTDGALTALLALARLGGKETQRDLLKALARFPLDNLSEEQKLAKLRLIEVSFARQGRPEPDLAKLAIEKLGRQYPARSWPLNRELSQLLIHLEAPDAVTKTLDLLANAQTLEEQIHYVISLRNLKSGWTLEQRAAYFGWFNRDRKFDRHPGGTIQWFADAGRDYSDGSSFPRFMANMRKAAAAGLTELEHAALDSIIAAAPVAPRPPSVPRQFVKEWKVEDFLSELAAVSLGRNFPQGKQAFNDAQCIACHRFGNEGGSVGPELTAASSKYARRDILESILEPSKVVSEQYQNMTLVLKDGDDVTGRIIDEDNARLVLVTDPLKQTQQEVWKRDIKERRPSALSPMPEGLVNILSKEEILDLLAYLESGGKATAAAFTGSK
jgi:putative heme-binding domain-containing protein